MGSRRPGVAAASGDIAGHQRHVVSVGGTRQWAEALLGGTRAPVGARRVGWLACGPRLVVEELRLTSGVRSKKLIRKLNSKLN
jgi:hypothetical protein